MILQLPLIMLLTILQLEPELIGVVYLLDGHKLVSLERGTAVGKSKPRALGFGGARSLAEVKGERSPVRMKMGQSLEFILNTTPGVDPTKYRLYKMDSKKGKREMTVMEAAPLGLNAKSVMDRCEVPTNISRFSASSVRIVPIQRPAPGEYCFSPLGVNDVFCFGVDPN